ncbi:glycogen debranching N-terminal domain-containing protein [Streptomyces endophyticus]|uniref:Amylo-alpha-1,6-glucosidase n=1 Tax=Streptomyces endophyticus TaxID=714166 RepID=A0ABU6EWC8_9ACTN|nr:glycogen debranching N-terminal domain-containing protein [Streptomyces endophyticus]MEB8336050.1 amylo-alpha-1,6-glucosidase [Streptomyces endophyticus]
MTVKTPEATEATNTAAEAGLQPFLHDAIVTMRAPSFVVSRPDGRFGGGADGFFHGERRALSRLDITADGVPMAWVVGGLEGADRAVFRTILRGAAETTPDPAVVLTRHRHTEAGCFTDRIEVVNSGRIPAEFRLTVTAGTDLATTEQVKSGTHVADAEVTAGGSGALAWSDGTYTVCLAGTRPAIAGTTPGVLHYDLVLAPGERWETELVCTAEDAQGVPFPAPDAAAPAAWSRPELRSADRSLDRWLTQADADLDGLLLADPEHPADRFLAAGAPWFATLFGRDSLWAARMLLPLGTDLAASTLRVLARRQGRIDDPRTQEQPGKILHEVRRGGLRLDGGEIDLPPVYYGTIDATPLWLTLLHDAWRWGLPAEDVEALLPHAEAALAWLRDFGDADGDGFLEYVDTTGKGLANQGWKDSGDSVRFRDGGFAEAPVALCEVQAYAYEAARGGAALLRAFGRGGADEWEEWAERLKSRFRSAFWVEDARGAYPAIALDGAKRPVDSATSNIGHLLGTGLLDRAESELIAKRLTGPDFDSGFGLRTITSDFPRYNPTGYHLGSVWPHDTAIAVQGLARAGLGEAAGRLATGLIHAADGFDSRLPELFAGYGTDESRHPVPYPASCRPQAWAAASAIHVTGALLGLSANVPDGTVTVAAEVHPDFRPLRLSGLRVAGEPMEIDVAADGTPTVTAPSGITVRTV